jgi:pimeloyl-ACP methyl ester carboxylesterase
VLNAWKGTFMASIVIVHGAFGGGWQWRDVAALLRVRGHVVFTPSLTGFGERVHLATSEMGVETHIQDILNLLFYEDLDNVVLVCQSYGGMVVTGVAGRMPERLAHLVYFNALVPEDGQSAFDLLPPSMRERFEEGAQTAGGGWRIPVPPLEADPQIAAFARGRFVPTPLRPFTEPIHIEPMPGRLKRTFIWCTEDPQGLSGVADVMRPFAERAQGDPNWGFHLLNAVPDAYIQMPDAVADLIDAAARLN